MSGAGVIYFPNGFYKIGKPLRIPENGTQNLTFVGEGRTNTYIAPLHADIAQGDPAGVNALIINQANNGKFSMSNLRFWSHNSYLGWVIYAVEGGNGGAQAIFSGSIDNCWFGLGEAAAGVLRGGLNNYRISNCTFEGMQCCFKRVGPGMADVFFVNNVVYACLDAFYDGLTDTSGDAMVTIDGLHVYSHRRGHVVQTRNSHDMTISNVMLQSAVEANITGDIGLFRFTDCTRVICNVFNASRGTPEVTGAFADAIGIANSQVKLVNGIINGAFYGIRITGNAVVDVSVDNVDIVNSAYSAFEVQNGAPSGRVRVGDRNWSDCAGSLVSFTSAAAFDFHANNCRFTNAGMTNASARNIDIATSGSAEFERCVIGRDKTGAAASYFVAARGSGELIFLRPQFLGVPPGGIKTGAQVAYQTPDPAPLTL